MEEKEKQEQFTHSEGSGTRTVRVVRNSLGSSLHFPEAMGKSQPTLLRRAMSGSMAL